jgi:hypothetical protein
MADSVRDALERLPVPPEREGFFEELWKQAELRERRAARRWRRISAGLAAVVLGAATAAGVLAFGNDGQVLDRTFSCPAGNSNQLAVGGRVQGRYSYASLEVRPAIVLQALVSAQDGNKGSIVWPPDYAGCQQVSRTIPLKPSGLPALALGTITTITGGYKGASVKCYMPSAVLFRARITVDGSGRPRNLAMAVWTAKKPIAFFDLRPPQVHAYATQSCQPT